MQYSKMVFLTLVLCVISAICHIGSRASTTVILPFKIEATTSPSPAVPGPITLYLTVEPLEPLVKGYDIQVRIDSIYNLTYEGPRLLTSDAPDSGESSLFEFSIIIPSNDTSGFEFNVSASGVGQLKKVYWVVADDSAKIYTGDPRQYLSAKLARIKPKFITPEEQRRQKMHELEKTPLTKSDVQTFHIGDTVYVRNRGEYKFRREEINVDNDAMLEKVRKIEKDIYNEKLFQYELDLRRSEDKATVLKMVDSLQTTDKQGIYRTFTTHKIRDQLLESGIILEEL